MRDPYEVLGVGRDEQPEMIQLAWLSKSKVYDPVTGTEPDPNKKVEIDAAFEQLRDPARRARVDAELAPQAPPPPPPPTAPAPAAAPQVSSAPPPPPSPGRPGSSGWVPAGPTTKRTSPLAIVSLILLFIFMPAAALTAWIARRQIKRSNGHLTGMWMTTIVLTIFWLAVALLVIAVLASGGS